MSAPSINAHDLPRPTARSRTIRRSWHVDHHVYRCYDKDGDLIYIGCTSDVKRRIAAHKRGQNTVGKWLAACMDRYEVAGPYRGRDKVRDAESEAIAIESPIFNSQERRVPLWLTRPDVARYLVERGHYELAAETACTCFPGDVEAELPPELCIAHTALRERAS